ncbi:MAG: permease [Clostridia bacterium]|nr:permease [Clostridia bacterium]
MNFVNGLFSLSGTTVVLAGAFLICFVGYALGRIKIKGVSLGAAGVFLIALLFGYLFTLPGLQNIPLLSKFFIEGNKASAFTSYKFIETIGLVLFVTGVGYIAGPNFFRNLKQNAKSYVPLGIIIILVGAALTVAFALIPGIGADFSNGILSGALTSTPAFSAAKQVASEEGLVALGHAIAYPFGVVGVVLFVQIVPKLLRCDMAKERESIKIAKKESVDKKKKNNKTISLDEFGFAPFGLAIIIGILVGSIKIPLTGEGFSGACFSLGNTGGPLIVALILGHFGHIGKLSLEIPSSTLKVFREFGLILFLIGAGVEGGVELVSQVAASEYGVMLVVYGFIAGAVMTILPLFIGYFFAKKVCKLSLLNNLGSLTGGMTSTPALGTLVGVSGTDDVASAYAATYPIALICIVLASNLIGTFIK